MLAHPSCPPDRHSTQALLGAEQSIDRLDRQVGPLQRPAAFDTIVECQAEEDGPRGNRGDELMKVDRELVLLPRKEARPRGEPAGETAGDDLNRLAVVGLGEEPSGQHAARP
jgi:hypothetical protein